jgi:hypothetical protein
MALLLCRQFSITIKSNTKLLDLFINSKAFALTYINNFFGSQT